MTNRQRNNRSFIKFLLIGVLAWLAFAALSALIGINAAALLRESMNDRVAGTIGMGICMCLTILSTLIIPLIIKAFVPQPLPKDVN